MKEKYTPEKVSPRDPRWQGHMVRDGCLKRHNFCEVFPTNEWKNILNQKESHHKNILEFIQTNENNPIRELSQGASFLLSDLYRGSLVRIEKTTVEDFEREIKEGAYYGIWDSYKNQTEDIGASYLHLFEYQPDGVLRFDTSEGMMAVRYDIGKPKHLIVKHKEYHSFKLELVTKLDVLRIGFGQKTSETQKQNWLGTKLKPVLNRMRT